MKKNGYIVLLALLLVLTTACGQLEQEEKTDNTQHKQETSIAKPLVEMAAVGVIGGDLPVSRAQAAKNMVQALFSEQEIQSMKTTIEFSDISPKDPNYAYMNCAASKGLMLGEGGRFEPFEFLTISQAQALIDRIHPGNRTKIKITEEIKNKPVSYALWAELLEKALIARGTGQVLAEIGIEETELFVFDSTPEGVYTQRGFLSFSDEMGAGLVGTKCLVLVKDNVILLWKEVKDIAPLAEGVFVVSVSEDSIEINIGGRSKRFAYHSDSDAMQKISPIADVKFQNGTIESMQYIAKKKEGVVKKITGQSVTFAQEELEFNRRIPVYNITGDTVVFQDYKNILCGTNTTQFYLQDGQVRAAVIHEVAKPNKIRVLLSADGLEGYFHPSVTVVSKNGMTLFENGQERKLSQGEAITFDTATAVQGRIQVSAQEDEQIQIPSLQRTEHIPSYRGVIEIEKTEKGYLIVNELAMEEYLYSVVPAEMPASFGAEALKAQAVTARSYAYNQFYANRFCEYGANVDDSTKCQVYNPVYEKKEAMEAVDATKGLCLTNEGMVISANFFSTSCGVTANAGEVWPDTKTKAFPANTPEYLTSQKQYLSGEYGDLSEEENLSRFLKEAPPSYDSHSSWYRWNITMSAEEVKASIEKALQSIWDNSPSMVQIVDENGTQVGSVPQTIGRIKDITVSSRGAGGIARELTITAEKAKIIVAGEYNIRKLLQPKNNGGGNDIVTYGLYGAQFLNLPILPSAFFVLKQETLVDGFPASFTFTGGGNGHGVGMSQNGAKYLSDHGFTYQEILEHFYRNLKISQFN